MSKGVNECWPIISLDIGTAFLRGPNLAVLGSQEHRDEVLFLEGMEERWVFVGLPPTPRCQGSVSDRYLPVGHSATRVCDGSDLPGLEEHLRSWRCPACLPLQLGRYDHGEEDVAGRVEQELRVQLLCVRCGGGIRGADGDGARGRLGGYWEVG